MNERAKTSGRIDETATNNIATGICSLAKPKSVKERGVNGSEERVGT